MPRMQNDFWNWSVNVYENPATKTACLHAQNTYLLDVNTLLWLCWLATKNKAPSPKALEKCEDIRRRWSQKLTNNIRRARKTVSASTLPTAPKLKTELLKLELMCEKHHQQDLENITQYTTEVSDMSPQALCHQNMGRYLASQHSVERAAITATKALCFSIFGS